MRRLAVCSSLFIFAVLSTYGQQPTHNAPFKLALSSSHGQLSWNADGYMIVETSAKPGGREIGIRAKDGVDRLAFLGFLFHVDEPKPVTAANCRDQVLKEDKKENPTLKVTATSEIARSGGLPIALVDYTTQDRARKTWYMVRGFVASGDICGDLEFYGTTPIKAEDPDLKKIFESYRLDLAYVPQFNDVFIYGEILYNHAMYKAAAPVFEQALSMLSDDKSQDKMRRVTTDQAGMSYGISGDIPRARAIFNAAIAKDPEYPLYYYNLACADAEENKLAEARVHLQQAFDRKQNVIPGETIPDPSKDDSFLPHRGNKDFWSFVETLH
jgi:tetratricopeptide (TPR) repeat protein